MWYKLSIDVTKLQLCDLITTCLKWQKFGLGGGGGIELLHNIREPAIGFDVAPILLCDSIIV